MHVSNVSSLGVRETANVVNSPSALKTFSDEELARLALRTQLACIRDGLCGSRTLEIFHDKDAVKLTPSERAEVADEYHRIAQKTEKDPLYSAYFSEIKGRGDKALDAWFTMQNQMIAEMGLNTSNLGYYVLKQHAPLLEVPGVLDEILDTSRGLPKPK